MREMRSENDKAAIVTLFHGNYNFGGLLQAYALPVALEKYLGLPAEQIDYALCPAEAEEQTEKEPVSLLNRIYAFVWRISNCLEKRYFINRKRMFDEFIDDIPHSKETYRFDSISNVLNEYHIFICGGDQIWNDYQAIRWYRKEDSQVFTLQFVPEHIKKISYAPSMAVLELTEEFKKEFCIGVNRLDRVSVREKRSLPVLRKLTDKPVKVAVDPVLLLKESDWLKEINYSGKKEKYILCYLLSDSISQRKALTKLAKKLNYKIITFPHILHNIVRKCDLFFGDIRDYSSGPREFIELIKNAEMVITDSFHACVFSMIFKTPFAVFERNKIGENGNMNSRIYDFLEEYHLENQLVTEKELTEMQEIPKIDFTYAHEHWEKRRQESLKYLENALKNN